MTLGYISTLQAATINPWVSMGLNSNCLNAELPQNFFSDRSCTVPLAPPAAQLGLLQALPLHQPSFMWFRGIHTRLNAANTELIMQSTIFKLLMHCSSYNSWIVRYLSLLCASDFWFVRWFETKKKCSARGSKIATEKNPIS